MTTIEFDELVDEILDERSDRALVILCSSIIDNQLFEILDAFLLFSINKKKNDELLKGDSPLSTFSSKIKVLYRLGVIDKSLRDAIDTVRKIRNDCAHQITININKSPIKDHIKRLKDIIVNRKTYGLAKTRFFNEALNPISEIKAIFITISLILEAINKSITQIEPNLKTIKISKG